MAIDSLGGKEPIKNEKKYTMESLGIKEGSEDASIFNKIDKSDGKEDGALSQFQFILFLKTWIRKTLNNKDEEIKRLDSMEVELQKKQERIEERLKNIKK